MKNIDVSQGRFEAHQLNFDFRGLCFGNIFLAGDAAGLVYPFTGEGIHPAFVSGEEIAKRIINDEYEINIRDILIKKRVQDVILQILIKSGLFRPLIHEIIAMALKSKLLRPKTVKIFT